MPIAIILVGLPSSGKSEYIEYIRKDTFKVYDDELVNLEDIPLEDSIIAHPILCLGPTRNSVITKLSDRGFSIRVFYFQKDLKKCIDNAKRKPGKNVLGLLHFLHRMYEPPKEDILIWSDTVEKRISSSAITKLNKDEIFVFGSNTSGRHGKGAAKTALQWGAVYGKGLGLYGQTYAIPTVNSTVTRSLSLNEIQLYVDTFIDFAIDNPKFKFLVTLIRCGLAGFSVKQIAPLFKRATLIKNIYLPIEFWSFYEGQENG